MTPSPQELKFHIKHKQIVKTNIYSIEIINGKTFAVLEIDDIKYYKQIRQSK